LPKIQTVIQIKLVKITDVHCSATFYNKFKMNFFEIYYIKYLEGEYTSLEPKNNFEIFIFKHKISICNLKLIAKTMENENFKRIFLKL
jgi:hypothetical protein